MVEDKENRDIPLEERLKKSPIHRSLEVEDIFDRLSVPHQVREPFHEVLIARGDYSREINPEGAKEFARRARAITEYYEMKPLDARKMLGAFVYIIEQWQVADDK